MTSLVSCAKLSSCSGECFSLTLNTYILKYYSTIILRTELKF